MEKRIKEEIRCRWKIENKYKNNHKKIDKEIWKRI